MGGLCLLKKAAAPVIIPEDYCLASGTLGVPKRVRGVYFFFSVPRKPSANLCG